MSSQHRLQLRHVRETKRLSSAKPRERDAESGEEGRGSVRGASSPLASSNKACRGTTHNECARSREGANVRRRLNGATDAGLVSKAGTRHSAKGSPPTSSSSHRFRPSHSDMNAEARMGAAKEALREGSTPASSEAGSPRVEDESYSGSTANRTRVEGLQQSSSAHRPLPSSH